MSIWCEVNSIPLPRNSLFQITELEDEISTQREAIDLILNDDSDTPLYPNNFKISFRTHFERLGQVTELVKRVRKESPRLLRRRGLRG